MNLLFGDLQALSREGIRAVLLRTYPEITFVEAFSRQELNGQMMNGQVDIALIDPLSFSQFEFSDISLVRAQNIKISYIIFASSLDQELMSKAIDYNVDAFLSKDCDVAEFSKAIELVRSGKKYYCSELSEYLYQLHTRDKQIVIASSKKHLLTAKEEEIVRLIGEGLSAKEIANKLFISVHTSNTHRKNIYRKCNVRNTSELVMFALKNGIIERIEYYI